jgi:hypothetical protein
MLRQSGIAIIIVHHANRDGSEMRGTSRREDAADWVIKVSPNFKFAKIDKGTAFTTTFTKNREDYLKSFLTPLPIRNYQFIKKWPSRNLSYKISNLSMNQAKHISLLMMALAL